MISKKALAGLVSEKEKKENPHNLNSAVSAIRQRNAALRDAAGGCGQSGQPKCTPRKK